MKLFFTYTILIFLATNVQAQCPVINGAMVNACGATEGLNEFVVFTTAVTANTSTYDVNYGTANNPPISNRLSGQNATAKTGTGTITATGGCTLTIVTSPTTSIPANTRVVFLPASTDNNYDLSSVCAGTSIYVVYIANTTAPSSWSAMGVLANNPASPGRYLQVTNSSTAGCTSAGAAVVNYVGSGWATNADGNFVTWNAAGTPTYSNNGCTNVVLPITNIKLNAIANKSFNSINWQTELEINVNKFVVEKSIDAVNFFEIGNLTAKGNNALYNYNDADIQKGKSYYRILIEDRDGKKTYSSIVSVTNENLVAFYCYPKLANNIVNLQWEASQAKAAVITVMDNIGRVLLIKKTSSIAGYNKTNINIDALPKGQYYIRLDNGNTKMTDSFVK